MDINLILPLIGVLASVITSFVISTRQSRLEVKKLRDEYSQRYSGKIFDQRLVSYPKIVEHLVPFFHKYNLYKINREQRYEIGVEDLKNLLHVLLIWDIQNSTLFSENLQTVFHNTYQELYKRINKPNEELKHLDELRNGLFDLYLALKNDLGIYSFESPSAITGFKSPNNMTDLANLRH